jgi:hypothetical protein
MAVRPVVRPATRWKLGVPIASERIMSGRMVANRRTNIDLPAPARHKKDRLLSERLPRDCLHNANNRGS